MFNIYEFIIDFINYYKSYNKNEYDLTLIFDDFMDERENNFEIIVKHFIKDHNEINKLLDEYKTYEIILYEYKSLYSKLYDIIEKSFEDFYHDKN